MGFWSNEKWLAAHRSREIVSGFSPKALKDGAYRLSLGDEAIVSSDEKTGAYKNLPETDVLYLQPGQFSYLITKEFIHIPQEAIGFINVATSVKFEGLINISGFHVDPQYSGRLIFTVFNAGPAVIALHQGQQLFRMWLCDFEGPSEKPQTSYHKIPKEWAGRLHGTYPSPFALARRVSDLEARLEGLKTTRFQQYFAVGVIALLLLPFAASLYANVFSPPYGAMIQERFEALKKSVGIGGTSQSAASTSPPAANIPSNNAKPAPQAPP